jgi:hypothetical protein
VTIPNEFSMKGTEPAPGRPGQYEVADREGGSHLDELGARPDLVKRQDAGGGPPHDHEEVVDARPESEDHRGDGHRDQLGFPRLHGQQAHDAHCDDGQTADRGNPTQVPGDLRFMAVDVVANQGVEGGHQYENREPSA